MNSRICSGKVMHARCSPVAHQWVFPYIFYAIDLNELEALDRQVGGFGYNRWRAVSLRDASKGLCNDRAGQSSRITRAQPCTLSDALDTRVLVGPVPATVNAVCHGPCDG